MEKNIKRKRLLNYFTILSLSLVFFGCGGPTIDKDSEEFDYIEIFTKFEI